MLFADDRSDGAEMAWAWICAQEWSGWRVDILTVEPVGVSHQASLSPREWVPQAPRVAPEGAKIANLRHLVSDGDPRAVLSELPADLLVIGRRGQGFLKRMHVGSVAESLLDCPQAPLVIPQNDDPVRKVLLAVDGSTHSKRATDVLRSMPWLGATRVTVLGVDEGDGAATTAVDEASTALDGVAAAVDRRAISHDPMALTVNVRYEIDTYLVDHTCDLIVVGTKGLHGLKRLRLGSVADYLAHHSDCGILLARDAHDD